MTARSQTPEPDALRVEAADLLTRLSGVEVAADSPIGTVMQAYRVAGRRALPENGGSQALFSRVAEARLILGG